MSANVSIALFWGVLKYLPSGFVGQSVTINICNVQNQCKSGSGQIRLLDAGLGVTGSVNIDTAPFTIDSIRITYGNNDIASISGVNLIADNPGSYSVTVREVYKFGLPLDFSLTTEAGGNPVWSLKSSVFNSILRGGKVPTSFSVEYIADDGSTISTDNSPKTSFDFSKTIAVTFDLASTVTGNKRLCRVRIYGDNLLIAEMEAKAQDQCVTITESANFGYKETIYVM